MGMSIRFTETIKQLSYPTDMNELDELLAAGGHVVLDATWMEQYPWNYVGLEQEYANDNGDLLIYAPTDRQLAPASHTYAGWVEFRDKLAKFFANCALAEVMDHPDEHRGRTLFYNLMDNSAHEGFISPTAVRLIASDFRAASTLKNNRGWALEAEFLGTMTVMGAFHYNEMYRNLKAGVLASAMRGGAMVFG